jgi:gluconolactonase
MSRKRRRDPHDPSRIEGKAMHSYAQTNIQLFNQLRLEGYSRPDLDLVRHAYELAMVRFSGRFQPSGKSFIAHVVGTASILASLRLPAPVVAAGLLHNVYEHGDFGIARRNASRGKRRNIRRLLGSEVEEYITKFPALHWKSPAVQLSLDNPDRLALVDRHVVSIRLADYLEHLLDLDLLYYGSAMRRYYTDSGGIAIAVAERFGLRSLAAELKQACRETKSMELPVNLPADRVRNGSFVIAPMSCRKRLLVTLFQTLVHGTHHLRSKIQKTLRVLYRKSTGFPKALLRAQQRYAIGRKTKCKPLSECLEANSDKFGDLFSTDAVLECVATGFRFTEGPVWIAEKKSLFFSDIPSNKLLELRTDGRVKTFRKPSGNSNGLTRDKEGRLIACEQGNRRVTRTEKDGSTTILTEAFLGKKLNSPNDVIVKSDGAIYFTDPSYGIKPDQQEQSVEGVYRLTPDGRELSLVAGDFSRPNGLAFSPDERTLYIDDSQRRHIRAFRVADDGSLLGGTVFQDMNIEIPGSPDGMKVDVEGRIYCTGAGGVWVFDSNGTHLGTIVTPEKPSNCAWGGSDWRTLYITASASVYAIRVRIPGIHLVCGS